MTDDRPLYSWNQPICSSCWEQRFPNEAPPRVILRTEETCAYCGARTLDGIYVRGDPALVPYPSREKS